MKYIAISAKVGFPTTLQRKLTPVQVVSLSQNFRNRRLGRELFFRRRFASERDAGLLKQFNGGDLCSKNSHLCQR